MIEKPVFLNKILLVKVCSAKLAFFALLTTETTLGKRRAHPSQSTWS